MPRRQRTFDRICWRVVLAAVFMSPLAPAPAAAQRSADANAAIERGLDYLVAGQSDDGAWRSDVYPTFKAGDALTPLVLMALVAAERGDDTAPIHAGCAFLTALVDEQGQVRPTDDGLAYPTYTAAGAVIVLSRFGERYDASCQAWLGYLRKRQLGESLGWQTDDAFYGGWGYSADLPRKPAPGSPLSPLAEPNLSATVFALAALGPAGIPSDAAEFRRARRFVERCQNDGHGDPAAATPPVADGGFHFMLADLVRNKAGIAGIDDHGRQQFASYGSATADGLRSLQMCGARGDDPRVIAAWDWLARNFSAESHPGRYALDREAARQAPYYYYCLSLAEALAAAPAGSLPPAVDRAAWCLAIQRALVDRQRADGSWANAAVDLREDDPLVATSLAVRTLALCRQTIMVESRPAAPERSPDDRSQLTTPPLDASR